MHTVRRSSKRSTEHEDVRAAAELDAAVCDEAVELIVAIRSALAEGRSDELRTMAHPRTLESEHARIVRRLGGAAAERFWSEASAEVEAVRIVSDGVVEVYEHIRHPPSMLTMRLASTAEHVKGRWRLVDTREAGDERVTAVLLRGAPPELDLDGPMWTRRWRDEHGDTARLSFRSGRGVVEHPDRGWTALVRTGSGRELARVLGMTGSPAELLEKQPAATIVSLVPVLRARARTEQLRWISRVVAAFGAEDASSVWVPSAAKAIPFVTWRAAMDGPLELPALSALWLRTQRQRGAWVTRGMSAFMLPEVEVWCAGMNVATVRALLREAVGRLLAHHEARLLRNLDATAPAVPAAGPRLYRRGDEGPVSLPIAELESSLELGDCFVVADIESVLGRGRQGPRPGESYGRWGAIALRSERAWWVDAA